MLDEAGLACSGWRFRSGKDVLARWLTVAALCVMADPLAMAGELTSHRIVRGAQQVQDLTFPSEPSTLSAVSQPQMAIYKPEAKGRSRRLC